MTPRDKAARAKWTEKYLKEEQSAEAERLAFEEFKAAKAKAEAEAAAKATELPKDE